MNRWILSYDKLALMPLIRTVILLMFTFSFSAKTLAEQSINEQGQYFIESFDMSAFGHEGRNYAISADHQGQLFFANTNSVFTFDGVRWNIIPTTLNIKPRSLSRFWAGRIYVGSLQGFGYLERDKLGQWQYHDLTHLIGNGQQRTSEIREIVPRSEGVYFRSTEVIYFYQNTGNIQLMMSTGADFHRMYEVDNRLIAQHRRSGLSVVKNGHLQPLVFTEFFKDKSIFGLLSVDSQLMLASYNRGIYLYDGNIFRPWEMEAKVRDILADHQIYLATRLSNGLLALAITGPHDQGLMLLSGNGKLLRQVTIADGLPGDLINTLYEDHQGALWLGMEEGLARIEVSSGLSYFDKQHGLQGVTYQLQRHKGKLYSANSDGVYRLDSTEQGAAFVKVEGSTRMCGSLISIEQGLLARCETDVLLLAGKGNPKAVLANLGVIVESMMLYHQSQNKVEILIGHAKGLELLSYDNGRWAHKPFARDLFAQPAMHLAKEDPGSVWINSNSDVITAVRLPQGSGGVVSVEQYGAKANLPSGRVVPVKLEFGVVFNTVDGVYRFDESSGKFVIESRLGDLKGKDVFVSQTKDGPIMMLEFLKRDGKSAIAGGTSLALARRSGNGYQWDTQSVKRLSSYRPGSILAEKDGVTWVVGGKGLIRFDAKAERTASNPFKPYISQLKTLSNGKDLALPVSSEPLVLPYKDNGLQFAFAYSAFDERNQTRYQYMLEGFDKQYSPWSEQTYRDYSYLKEGDYRFLLRAKDVYGQLSEANPIEISILAPWYRTVWAYIAYCAFTLMAVFVLMHMRTKALKQKAQELEGIIEQRTKTIREGAQLIEQQKQSIEDLLNQKNDLFANISHEFRTPLTLILGPISSLLKGDMTKQQREHLELIRSSSYRLLRMVNQILTLAKLSAIPFQERVGLSLKDHVDFMISSFAPLAKEKGIALTVGQFAETKLHMVSDSLEKILVNLLSNALKYTPNGGKVSLSIEPMGEERIAIIVSDTGFGIPQEQLPLVFARFKRINHPEHVKVQGTGLGLSMVKELVESHGGNISLTSTLGKGSVFRVELPVVPTAEQASIQSAGLSAAHASVDLELKAFEEKPLETNQPEQAKQSNPNSPDKPSLLVIEDTPQMNEFVQSLFVDEYQVYSAFDGETGIELAKKQLPDIIISDLMMPGKNGYEVCRELKGDELTSHIPIILLTAKADLESRKKGWQKQADEYLAKPFDEEELKMRVDNLLTIRQTLKARFGRVLHDHPEELPELITELSDKDQQFLQRFAALIEARHADSELNLPGAARELAVSERLLQKKLKALLDHNFTDYLRAFRLNRAAELLKEGQRASDVAFETGFSSQAYFSRCFKAEFGMTATQYVQQKN